MRAWAADVTLRAAAGRRVLASWFARRCWETSPFITRWAARQGARCGPSPRSVISLAVGQALGPCHVGTRRRGPSRREPLSCTNDGGAGSKTKNPGRDGDRVAELGARAAASSRGTFLMAIAACRWRPAMTPDPVPPLITALSELGVEHPAVRTEHPCDVGSAGMWVMSSPIAAASIDQRRMG